MYTYTYTYILTNVCTSIHNPLCAIHTSVVHCPLCTIYVPAMCCPLYTIHIPAMYRPVCYLSFTPHTVHYSHTHYVSYGLLYVMCTHLLYITHCTLCTYSSDAILLYRHHIYRSCTCHISHTDVMSVIHGCHIHYTDVMSDRCRSNVIIIVKCNVPCTVRCRCCCSRYFT